LGKNFEFTPGDFFGDGKSQTENGKRKSLSPDFVIYQQYRARRRLIQEAGPFADSRLLTRALSLCPHVFRFESAVRLDTASVAK
jgi:hypothetical protein